MITLLNSKNDNHLMYYFFFFLPPYTIIVTTIMMELNNSDTIGEFYVTLEPKEAEHPTD